MIVYFNGKYLPLNDVKISPFDRGFQFAYGVYEVIRTYNGKLFEFNSHIKRLKYSLDELSINYNELDEFEFIINHLAEQNKISGKDFSVYIQITRGEQFSRKHNYEENLTPTIFINISELSDINIQKDKGVKVILERDIRWSRCDIKTISILPASLANTRALKSGSYEAVFYRDNLITEGSHTNFFGIKDEVVYTAPKSNFILEGVTRNIVIELCKKNNIKIVEDYIRLEQISAFDEFFLTGTKTEITPVIQIDNHLVKDGSIGETTKLLQKYFYEIVNSF